MLENGHSYREPHETKRRINIIHGQDSVMYRAVSYLMRYHSEVIPQEYVYVMKTEGPRTEPFSTPYNDDTIKMHNPIFFPSTI